MFFVGYIEKKLKKRTRDQYIMRHLLPYLLLSEHVHRMAFPTRNRLRINIQINSTDALHYYKYNNAQKFTEMYIV